MWSEARPQLTLTVSLSPGEFRLSLEDPQGAIDQAPLEMSVNVLKGQIERNGHLDIIVPIHRTTEW